MTRLKQVLQGGMPKPNLLKELISAASLYPKLSGAGFFALGLQLVGTLTLVPLAEYMTALFAEGALPAIALTLGGVIGGYLLKHLGEYVQQYAAGVLSLRWQKDRQSQLYERILRTDIAVLAELQPEYLQSVMHEDVQQIQQALFFFMYRWVPASVLLLVLLGTLFYLSWVFTFLMLALVGIARLLLGGIQAHLPSSSLVLQLIKAELYHEFGEAFRGRWLIRRYGWEFLQNQRLKALHERWLGAARQVLALQALERPLMGMVQVSIIGLVLFVSVWAVRQGLLDLGTLMAFATALALAIDPGLWWAEARSVFRRAQGSWTRLMALESVLEVRSVTPVLHEGPYLRLQEVTLRRGEQCLATGLHWDIPLGAKWALTGNSGEGKSSLVSVLACVEAPHAGSVHWPKQWQQPHAVVVVAQDTFFFHRSVRENLLGPLQVDEPILWQVLADCQMAERLRALPQQLETLMGEEGVHFSGGEKQRLALARALLLRPRCLILDEATTELDAQTEAAILQALLQDQELTCIVISHQPRTLHYVQQVWQLSHGVLHPVKATGVS